jgi:hypothetical protein
MSGFRLTMRRLWKALVGYELGSMESWSELKRFFECEPELPGRCLRDHYVAALNGPLEDRPRMPLRRHGPPGWAGRLP